MKQISVTGPNVFSNNSASPGLLTAAPVAIVIAPLIKEEPGFHPPGKFFEQPLCAL